MPNNKILSIINMKGGVGKTTLSVNISYTLAKKYGKKILLIDMDPQMNSSQYCLEPNDIGNILENPRKSVYGIFEPELPSLSNNQQDKKIETERFKVIDNFDIISSHLHLMIASVNDSPLKLKNYINSIQSEYDLIIIDAPPTISGYTKASLLASTHYIVPMRIDFLSLFGLPLLQTYITDLTEEYASHIDFTGIILTQKHTTHTKIYNSLIEKINENSLWQTKLFQNEMTYKTIIANSITNEKSNKFILDLGGEVSNEIDNITIELMRKIRL